MRRLQKKSQSRITKIESNFSKVKMENDYQGFIFNKISADAVLKEKEKNLLKKSSKLNSKKGKQFPKEMQIPN